MLIPKIFNLSILLIWAGNAIAQPASADLTVAVKDIEAPGKGIITILLFDQESQFGSNTDNAAYRGEVTNFSRFARYTFKDLPTGTYAIMAYQDLNENGTLDKNFIGFPKEPLSAYKMEKMRKPTFKKSSLTLGGQPVTAELKLLNQ